MVELNTREFHSYGSNALHNRKTLLLKAKWFASIAIASLLLACVYDHAFEKYFLDFFSLT